MCLLPDLRPVSADINQYHREVVHIAMTGVTWDAWSLTGMGTAMQPLGEEAILEYLTPKKE